MNLNDLKISVDRGDNVPLTDFSGSADHCHVEFHFRDLEARLVDLVSEADAVFGAVAWLTNVRVLNALAEVKDVSLVVQKEDFLRPDGGGDRWHERLRRLYSSLSCGFHRYMNLGLTTDMMSSCACPSIAPVRCVGNHNRERSPSSPRMHNKFLVFARSNPEWPKTDSAPPVIPYAVWTGSFNVTANATRSFENAVVIRDETVSAAYLKEFGQILALSEPLDWNSDWISPQWRIGT